MTKEAMKLALEALEGAEALLLSMGLTHLIVYGDAEKAITNLQKQLAEQPAQTDWEAVAADQAMTIALLKAEQPAQQEPAGWRPATFHRDNLTFNPGLPDEQTVKFWKLQGVEIEYCYTTPQPAQQEPVAQYIGESSEGSLVQLYDDVKKGTNLYTSPPAQRKPLTDEQIAKEVEAELVHYWNGEYIDTTGARDQLTAFARAIEAAHNIKENT